MPTLLSAILALLSQLVPIVPDLSQEQPPAVKMEVRPCSGATGPDQWLILACTLSVPDGWHIYWKNPGASGIPTTIEVQAPTGFTVNPAVFPRPLLINTPAGMTYGYKGEVTLLQPIRTPVSWKDPGRSPEFTVAGDWFVCNKRQCFIGNAEQRITLPWKDGIVPPEQWAIELMEQRIYPKPLRLRPGTSAEIRDDTLIIKGPPTKSSGIGFLPDPTPGVVMGVPVDRSSADALLVEIPLEIQHENMLGESPVARGLLTFGEQATMSSYRVSVPIEAVSKEIEVSEEQKEQP